MFVGKPDGEVGSLQELRFVLRLIQEETRSSGEAVGPLIRSKDELMPHVIAGSPANRSVCLKKGTKSTEPIVKSRSSFLFGLCFL